MRREGLLLVERFSTTAAPEVRRRYRGFDGVAWPGETIRDIGLSDGLAPISELRRLVPYVAGVEGVDLVYCVIGSSEPRDDLRFLGYDVGWYTSEYSHFSVILHEIIFGHLPRLTAYAEQLNEALLFDSLQAVADVIADRSLESRRPGADLEDANDEEIAPVMVFAP
jgi:hypothetical protein